MSPSDPKHHMHLYTLRIGHFDSQTWPPTYTSPAALLTIPALAFRQDLIAPSAADPALVYHGP